MTTQRPICLVCFLFAAGLLLAGCSTKPEVVQNTSAGVVSKDHRIDTTSLVPDSVRLDSDCDNFFFSDHLVFLGEKNGERYALSLTFNRALANDRFKRAERDFTGFLYQQRKWTNLPYTRMRHDSLRLDLNYPYIFGGLSFSDSHTAGELRYDRHDLRFDLQFDNLQPVQLTYSGVALRHCHAIGVGTLAFSNDTIVGQVYYELIQLEGHNPFVNITDGLTYTDYDWLALTSASGKRLLSSSDSTTGNDRIKKNFLSLEMGGSLRYADGSDNVRIISEAFCSDPLSSFAVLRENIAIPGLGIEVKMTIANDGVFNTTSYYLSLVDGTLTIDGKPEDAWGIVEQRR